MSSLSQLAEKIHKQAKDSGFWDNPNDGEKIALIHSELSECLESERHGNPQDEHCPEFTNSEIELADAIIRILDYACYKGFDMDKAIRAKMMFNEARTYRHGKNF